MSDINIERLEAIYSEVVLGQAEPDCIVAEAGHLRKMFGADIDPSIGDEVTVIMTSEGYEVLR